MEHSISTYKKRIFDVASKLLAGSRFSQVKYRLVENKYGANMLGGEVLPEPSVGTVVHIDEDLLILKTSPNTFHGFFINDLPAAPFLQIGDKAEIKFEGFQGTETITTKSGEGTTSTLIRRKTLKSPVNELELNQLTEQLSEMQLPDGRRGLHFLHDLNFSNFTGEGSEDYTKNPFVQFDIDNFRLKGKIKIEWIMGLDYYTVHFISETATEKVENVDFTSLLPVIYDRCDCRLHRVATVTLIKRAKRAKQVA